jgi:hypothetical protein
VLTKVSGPLCSSAGRLTSWDLKSTFECSTAIASHSLDLLAVGYSRLKCLSLFCFNCLRRFVSIVCVEWAQNCALLDCSIAGYLRGVFAQPISDGSQRLKSSPFSGPHV